MYSSNIPAVTFCLTLFSSEERDTLLGGTGVPESVIKDLGNIETEFREVVLPFVDQHIDKFR